MTDSAPSLGASGSSATLTTDLKPTPTLAITADVAINVLALVKDASDGFMPLKIVAVGALWIVDNVQQFRNNREDWLSLANLVATRIAEVIERVRQAPSPELEKDTDVLIGSMEMIKSKIQQQINRPKWQKIAQSKSEPKIIMALKQDFQQACDRFYSLSIISLRQGMSQVSNHAMRPAPVPNVGLRALPRVTRLFIGREDILSDMDKCFCHKAKGTPETQRVFVLCGLGGAGKTQIAMKFAQQQKDRYSSVYFVDATSEETIDASIVDIGRSIGIPKPSCENTLARLSREESEWLIIYDNADNPSLNLRQFFSPCNHGNIIVTTRNIACKIHAHRPEFACDVAGLAKADATSLMLSASGTFPTKENKDLASAIVETLGYLALAITQAGSYIMHSPGVTLTRYLSFFKTSRSKLLKQHSVQNTDDYQWTVYTTWELSFEKLGPQSRNFLDISAFLHHDSISEEIFKRAAVEEPAVAYPNIEVYHKVMELLEPWRSDEGCEDEERWDSFEFQQTISELCSYSLVSVGEDDSYSIHPLVHAWAKDRTQRTQLSENHAKACYLISMSANIQKQSVPDDFVFWRTLVAHIGELEQRPTDIDIQYGFGLVYLKAGQNPRAEQTLLAAMNRMTKELGTDDPLTLQCINHLAEAIGNQGRYAEAEKWYVDILKIMQRVLGPEHPQTLRVMTSLANKIRLQGRLQEAQKIQEEHLEITLRIHGPKHLDTAWSMSNMARMINRRKGWQEAVTLHLQATEIRQNILGLEHPNTLWSMSSLAEAKRGMGLLDEAKRLHEEVLNLRTKVLGSDHKDTLWSMAGLASVLRNQGRWSEAAVLLAQVVEKRVQFLGAEHPDTLVSMGSLARVLQDQGRLAEAEELQTDVLDLQQRVLGAEHPTTLWTMWSLAKTKALQSRWDVSERLLVHVLASRKTVLGSTHPDTLETLVDLAGIKSEQGHWHEAELMLREVLDTHRIDGRSEHPATSRILIALSATIEKQGRWDEAEVFELQVLDRMKQTNGENHPETLREMSRYANNLINQKRYREAHDLLGHVYKMKERMFGQDHPHTVEVAEELNRTRQLSEDEQGKTDNV